MIDKYMVMNLVFIIVGGILFLSLSDVVFDLFKKPRKTLKQLTVEAEEYERRSNSERN